MHPQLGIWKRFIRSLLSHMATKVSFVDSFFCFSHIANRYYTYISDLMILLLIYSPSFQIHRPPLLCNVNWYAFPVTYDT